MPFNRRRANTAQIVGLVCGRLENKRLLL